MLYCGELLTGVRHNHSHSQQMEIFYHLFQQAHIVSVIYHDLRLSVPLQHSTFNRTDCVVKFVFHLESGSY